MCNCPLGMTLSTSACGRLGTYLHVYLQRLLETDRRPPLSWYLRIGLLCAKCPCFSDSLAEPQEKVLTCALFPTCRSKGTCCSRLCVILVPNSKVHVWYRLTEAVHDQDHHQVFPKKAARIVLRFLFRSAGKIVGKLSFTLKEQEFKNNGNLKLLSEEDYRE